MLLTASYTRVPVTAGPVDLARKIWRVLKRIKLYSGFWGTMSGMTGMSTILDIAMGAQWPQWMGWGLAALSQLLLRLNEVERALEDGSMDKALDKMKEAEKAADKARAEAKEDDED